MLNRQTRLRRSKEWHSHGNVTFFEAIKKEAKQASKRNSLCEATWVIECRCESEPDTIDTFTVQVTLHAEILDPRKGA